MRLTSISPGGIPPTAAEGWARPVDAATVALPAASSNLLIPGELDSR